MTHSTTDNQLAALREELRKAVGRGRLAGWCVALLFAAVATPALAAQPASPGLFGPDQLIPGEIIRVQVQPSNQPHVDLVLLGDGRTYYPDVGEFVAMGKTTAEVAEVIRRGLEPVLRRVTVKVMLLQPRRLRPGDEIRIIVTPQGGPYNVDLTIPSDGRVFYPEVGEFVAAGKTRPEIEALLTRTLGRFIANVSVSVYFRERQQLRPGDVLRITTGPLGRADHRDVTVGPDGKILYPPLGSLVASGKTPAELLKVLREGLGKEFAASRVDVYWLADPPPGGDNARPAERER